MMDPVNPCLDKVAGLSNCPVCGAEVLKVSTSSIAIAYFDCGSVFTACCEEIKAELSCPRPTAVAVRALNAEVRTALSPASEEAA